MSNIIIKRSNEYINRLRDIQIIIDGKEVEKIANGETKDIAVNPGSHTISAKVDWGYSPVVTAILNDDDTLHMKLSSFKFGNYIPLLGLVFLVLHLIFSFTLDFTYLIYLIYPLALVFLYY